MHLGGAWGVGKTHFVFEYLKARDENSKKASFIYVSLSGITSASELRQAIFAAAYPMMFGKGAKLVGSISRSILSQVNLQTDIRLSDIKDLPTEKLIVIDDLERCAFDPVDALGQLNALVEHDGHKLIILSNEEKIAEESRERFNQSREKLIGQSFVVEADLESAFSYFVDNLRTDRAKTFFTTAKSALLQVYRDSKTDNLRTLQRAMEQFERLLEVLPDDILSNKASLVTLGQFFIAISIEYRTGRITQQQIRDRQTGLALEVWRLSSQKREEATPDEFGLANEKYGNVDLSSELLSNAALLRILVDGNIPADVIIADLRSHYAFSDIEPEDDWRTVWYGIERPVEEFETARTNMEKRWRDRGFRKPSEIIHVATLRLWLGGMDYGYGTRSELVNEAKAYIDDVYADGAFSTQQPRRGSGLDRLQSDGLGFHEIDTDEFKQIVEHLRYRRDQAYETGKSAWVQELLTHLETDPERFCLEVTPSVKDFSTYAYDAVLHLIDTGHFLDRVLALHPRQTRQVFIALEERCEAAHRHSIKSTEMAWIKEIKANLLVRAEQASGITRYLLQRIDEWHLSKAVSALEQKP